MKRLEKKGQRPPSEQGLRLGAMFDRVRRQRPILHSITNYVTANDCANLILAAGGSPIMAEDIGEVEAITAAADGLLLNLGTFRSERMPAMLAAGRRAGQLGHPLVLDPVAVGISPLRRQKAVELIDQLAVTVIRGNQSEIWSLATGCNSGQGVDAAMADRLTQQNREAVIDRVAEYSRRVQAIVVISGKTDLVTDGQTTYLIQNGHQLMSRITGAGCMLSALIGVYISANPQDLLTATLAAVCGFGLAGQKAAAQLSPTQGNAGYRQGLIDQVYHLTAAALERGSRYEVR